jgi:hypothetical protein
MKVIRTNRRRSQIYPPFGLSYAYPSGGPVLKEHATFSRINGVFFNTPITGCVWLLFRRHW